MENFKFGLFSIIILALLSFVSYWAFTSIESGSAHLNNQEIKELNKENRDLKEEVSDLRGQITLLESELSNNIKIDEENKVEVDKPTKPVTPSVSKYQSTIDELQKLVDGNINMKKGSQGQRVGTIQKFLNIYNKTSLRVDNDYGPGLESAVKKFQSEQGITSDGEAGPGTFRKMIDWLKKNS